ncbi:PAS domain-containing sensor histidine kinase [Natrinema salinisoli]|uniref:PAS domain-containing sensor histidine kinase n=1 Tax=Natrinema salinisoli TaxID=2878535 RepID=UPI003CCCFD87
MLQDQKRQLERERDLVHHILETSPIGIQVLDADGEITRMNDRLKEILEISTAEANTYDPSDRSVYDETGEELTIDEHPFAHTLETGEPVYEKMMRIELPSGDTRWLSVNAAPILTDDGTIDRVVTTAEDVTELKERERELSTELDEMFGRISDAFYALDEEFRFEHVNTQAEELLQHSENKLLGKKLWDVFPSAAEIDEVWDAFHTALETQEATSYELYYDELDFWVEANIYPSETGVSVYFRDVTERKEHEQELELFRTLLDHSSDSVFVIDPSTGQFLDVNGTACRRLGYDREELLELSVPDIEWGLPDLSVWESHVKEVKTEGGATFDGRHERKDGSTFPVEVNVSYADLSQEYVIAVARDVTERRQRERELEESERRYRTLAECFPNGIVTLFDDDLTYTLAAGRAFDDLPLDPDEVEGNPVQDVWGADTVAALEPQLRAALDDEETAIELEYAGREWVVYVVPVANDSGEIFAGMTMAQDITERKETERQLRHREHELEQYKEYTDDILGAIDDVFYVLDENGTLKRWNATVSEVTGYASDEVETMHALDFFAETDHEQIVNAIAEGFETGTTQVEANLQTKAGDEIPYEFVANSLENPAGDQVLTGIGRDVSAREEKRRKLEETVEQLETSNERLEQFAYAASHDLQEPLRMVSSYLQLLERRYGNALDEEGEEFLKFAVDGADRMRTMIEGLLAYSRVETKGNPIEPVDLEEILDDVVDDLQLRIAETDAELTVEELPCVEGDASQLRQMLQNLLSNAINYSGDKPPQIHVDAERRGEMWTISIHDEGIGIAPDDQERVFEIFKRLHGREAYEGAGIGLALCQRIIERHGGEIWVESELGEGATFSFALPAAGNDN